MSRSGDNCDASSTHFTLLDMDHPLDNTWQRLRYGEALLASSVEGLAQGLRTSTEAIGKLWTDGADRWQKAIRQMQAQLNRAGALPCSLADILRDRST
jgi:hypothetical protein